MRPVEERQRSGRRATGHRTPRGTLSALVIHTVRMQLKSVVIWGVSLGLYACAIVATFSTFDTRRINQITAAYPKGLLKAFGVTDLSTIEGFLDSEVFSFMAPLTLAFFPILALAGAVSGAEERGTIDLLLGNPIRRWQLVVGSSLATALSLLGILTLAGLLTRVAAALLNIDLSLEETAQGFLNLWPLCIFFGGIAMLCSTLLHRRSLAIAIPGFLLLAMYLLDTLGKVSKDVEDYRAYSVFRYYGSAIKDGIDWENFGGVTLGALALVLLAALVFRRDIYT